MHFGRLLALFWHRLGSMLVALGGIFGSILDLFSDHVKKQYTTLGPKFFFCNKSIQYLRRMHLFWIRPNESEASRRDLASEHVSKRFRSIYSKKCEKLHAALDWEVMVLTIVFSKNASF